MTDGFVQRYSAPGDRHEPGEQEAEKRARDALTRMGVSAARARGACMVDRLRSAEASLAAERARLARAARARDEAARALSAAETRLGHEAMLADDALRAAQHAEAEAASLRADAEALAAQAAAFRDIASSAELVLRAAEVRVSEETSARQAAEQAITAALQRLDLTEAMAERRNARQPAPGARRGPGTGRVRSVRVGATMIRPGDLARRAMAVLLGAEPAAL